MIISKKELKLFILNNASKLATNSSGKKYNTRQNLKASKTAVEEGIRENVRVEIANQMINEYKKQYPKTQYRTLQGLKYLLCTLIRDRESIALTSTSYFTVKTIKKMTDQLALIYPYLIETRAGFSRKKQGFPSFKASPVIQLTDDAIKHLYKHWLEYKWLNNGKELQLLIYKPNEYNPEKFRG